MNLDRDIHLVLDDGYEVQVRNSKPGSCTGKPKPSPGCPLVCAGQGALPSKARASPGRRQEAEGAGLALSCAPHDEARLTGSAAAQVQGSTASCSSSGSQQGAPGVCCAVSHSSLLDHSMMGRWASRALAGLLMSLSRRLVRLAHSPSRSRIKLGPDKISKSSQKPGMQHALLLLPNMLAH